MIRSTRFVSAAAGTYPAPRPVTAAGAAVREAPELDSLKTPEFAPEEDAVRSSGGESLASTGSADALQASNAPALVEELLIEQAPQGGQKTSVLAVLVGILCGAVLGVVASLLLLVFSLPDRDLGRLADPVDLWLSIDDPLVKTSALLIMAGFVLLGMGLASWSRQKA